MKRSINSVLTAALATLMLASCTDDVPVEVNHGRPIDFRSSIGSRNETTTISNLDEICVTALHIDGKNEDGTDHYRTNPYFGGGEDDANLSEIFKKEVNEKGDIYFRSTTNFYWPTDNSFLQFYAFAPTVNKMTGNPLTGASIGATSQVINFTTQGTFENQIDLVTAKAKQNKAGGEASGVSLNFNHQLAQIEIRAYANNPKYDFEVCGVRIARVPAKATYRFSNDEWVLGSYNQTAQAWNYDRSDRATYTYEDYSLNEKGEKVYNWKQLPIDGENSLCLMPTTKETNTDGNVIKTITHNAFLIPHTIVSWERGEDFDNNTNNGDAENKGSYIAIKLRVTEKNGGKVIFPDNWNPSNPTGNAWAAVPIKGTWVAGKKYIYTLNLSSGAGYADPDDNSLPGTPILSDPIEFTVTVTDFKGNPDPDGTPTDLEWDNGKKPGTGNTGNEGDEGGSGTGESGN